ncbi:MAG: tellurite resistance TerB family protein [Halioglobus sp.]
MDINKVVSGLASSGVLGGVAGGALGGALVGNKKVRKSAGTLLKVGGVAALCTMAWKAYQGYQSGQGSSPRPGSSSATGLHRNGARSVRDPVWDGLDEQCFAIEDDSADSGSAALLLVQAMVTAAGADGHVDRDERSRIMQRAESLSLPPEEKALLFEVLNRPLTMAQICERVDSPELATEVYLSSLLAVDTSHPEARVYLDGLAFRLGLPEGLVKELKARADEAEGLNVAA